MIKICPKCSWIAAYDPYFKADMCRQCGWMGARPWEIEPKAKEEERGLEK